MALLILLSVSNPKPILPAAQVKPDGVQRALVGEIISRFEKKGFTLKGLRMFVPSQGLAEEHYKDLSSKPFFKDLVSYITSGPVVAMVNHSHSRFSPNPVCFTFWTYSESPSLLAVHLKALYRALITIKIKVISFLQIVLAGWGNLRASLAKQSDLKSVGLGRWRGSGICSQTHRSHQSTQCRARNNQRRPSRWFTAMADSFAELWQARDYTWRKSM